MAIKHKNREAILQKLGIEQLNEMQLEAIKTIAKYDETILISPTGTGKTLAFLLPIIDSLETGVNGVQALLLVPSRELAIQIEQVIREMGSGYKAIALYGGRSGAKDKLDLRHPPSILTGTPGRIADRFRRGNIATKNIKTLVLDEYDKSLEVGFEKEMREIIESLPAVRKKILTSATRKTQLPEFAGIVKPKYLNFSKESEPKLSVKTVISETREKLATLEMILDHTRNECGIIFCNYKDTIALVSDFLRKTNIPHGCFYGGLEQLDRERALIKFRNGTHRLLVATDLAARGIDVPKIDFIIHYELPLKAHEFTHRNGRTARMQSDGTAYVIKWKEESLPGFIKGAIIKKLPPATDDFPAKWDTLYISGGRRDKISKGDIAGLFFKQGNLNKHELGTIELKQDCAYVAVSKSKANLIVKHLNNTRLKKKKVRMSLLR